jgi:hypothetical protein
MSRGQGARALFGVLVALTAGFFVLAAVTARRGPNLRDSAPPPLAGEASRAL